MKGKAFQAGGGYRVGDLVPNAEVGIPPNLIWNANDRSILWGTTYDTVDSFAFDENEPALYIGNRDSVVKMDVDGNVIWTIYLTGTAGYGIGVLYDPTQGRLYATHSRSTSIGLIELNPNTGQTISLETHWGSRVYSEVSISADGNWIYFLMYDGSNKYPMFCNTQDFSMQLPGGVSTVPLGGTRGVFAEGGGHFYTVTGYDNITWFRFDNPNWTYVTEYNLNINREIIGIAPREGYTEGYIIAAYYPNNAYYIYRMSNASSSAGSTQVTGRFTNLFSPYYNGTGGWWVDIRGNNDTWISKINGYANAVSIAGQGPIDYQSINPALLEMDGNQHPTYYQYEKAIYLNDGTAILFYYNFSEGKYGIQRVTSDYLLL